MTINCKGTLVDVASPKVMGILNITPDSFFDGGKYKNEKDILTQTEKMLFEGATFIDVGAYSSRPGAAHISEEEELNRIVPVINLLINDEDGFTAKDKNFALSIMLGIAFSANVGGIATIIGTPPNTVMAGFLENEYEL